MENYKTIKSNLVNQLNNALKENKAIKSLQFNKKTSGEDFALISKAVKNGEFINDKYCSPHYINIDGYLLTLNSSKTSEVKADLQKRFEYNQKLINDINIKLDELKNTYDLINQSIKELYQKIEAIAPNTKHYYDIQNFNRYDDRTIAQYEQEEKNEAFYNSMWDNLKEEIYKIDKFAFPGCSHEVESLESGRWAVKMSEFGETIILLVNKNEIIASKKITVEEERQIAMKLIEEKKYSFVNEVMAILGNEA